MSDPIVVGSAGQQLLEAARLMLSRMGVDPAELVAAPGQRGSLPTLGEYIEVVSQAVSTATRRTYASYWTRLAQEWGTRRLDEPTASQIQQLTERIKANAVVRSNSRGGRSTAENFIAALRCLYRHAEEEGLIHAADNPARKVTMPRRLPSTRRALTAARIFTSSPT